MGESILVLSLIIFFCIITDLIIIKKGNAVTLETMGIGLEMRCPDVNVNMISEKNFSMKEVSGIILFVQNDCNTCETVVNTMENSDLKNNNLYTIIVGEEEEAISFMGKHSSWERVGFLDSAHFLRTFNS